MTEDRVDWHLWSWARWMHLSKERMLLLPAEASGGLQNYTTGWDFDEEYNVVCMQLAAATDAVIDGLPPRYKEAVYAQHLGGKWTLPDIILGPYYRIAVVMVGKGLDRKGVE